MDTHLNEQDNPPPPRWGIRRAETVPVRSDSDGFNLGRYSGFRQNRMVYGHGQIPAETAPPPVIVPAPPPPPEQPAWGNYHYTAPAQSASVGARVRPYYSKNYLDRADAERIYSRSDERRVSFPAYTIAPGRDEPISERVRSRSSYQPRSEHESTSEDESSSNDSADDEIIREGTMSRRRVVVGRSRSYGHDDRYYSGEDDEDMDDAYSFNVPRYSSRNSQSESTLVGGETLSQSKDDASSVSQLPVGGSSKVRGETQNVYRAQYTGTASSGGAQSALLTVIPAEQKKSRPPLFRWIHLEDPAMHFDEFQASCSQTPGLTDIERAGIRKLLGRVRKTFNKPLHTSAGTKVRFMEPGVLQETLSSSGDDRPRGKMLRARTVTWVCLPYFVLEEYSGIASTAGYGPYTHPMQTLSQARFSGARKERDMNQAVCQIPGTPSGFCFHIAQIWCLVLDDSLVVTCTRLPASALHGESISVVKEPMPAEVSRPKSVEILVQYGAAVRWSFPLEDVQTWFAFISQFWEFWPRRFTITHNGRNLTADDWPRIVNLATHSNTRVCLNFQLGSGGVPMHKGIRNDVDAIGTPANTGGEKGNVKTSHLAAANADESRSKGKGAAGGLPPKVDINSTNDAFHVHTWFSTIQSTEGIKGIRVDEERLHELLDNMDQFLRIGTVPADRSAYKECPRKSLADVRELMTQEEKMISTPETTNPKVPDSTKRWKHESRMDLVNAAVSMYRFFLPVRVELESRTVSKYWGALHRMLTECSPFTEKSPSKGRAPNQHKIRAARTANWRNFEDMKNWLEKKVHSTQTFRHTFSQATAKGRLEIQIPDELLKAWLHLLMALIRSTRTQDLERRHQSVCSYLIDEGMKKMTQSISGTSLLERTTLLPMEIASLLKFRLMQDVTGAHPDITETYSEYLKGVEVDLDASPLDRAHQDRIALLHQEIDVIGETLNKQKLVFNEIQSINQIQGQVRGGGYVYPRSTEATYSGSRSTSRHRPRVADMSSSQVRSRSYEQDVYYPEDPYSVAYVNPGALQWQVSPTETSGLRELFTAEHLVQIEKRLLDFTEMRGMASYLGTMNLRRIESNKDRQESAIYAFTVVTIVFLPLSAVAGILGMNTKDIRDMERNQWIFWVVAIPLTVIIITLCLIWSGEFGNFRRGFASLWRSDRKKLPRIQ